MPTVLRPHIPRWEPTPHAAAPSVRRTASLWRFGVTCRDARQAEGIRAELLRGLGLEAQLVKGSIEPTPVAWPLALTVFLLTLLAVGLWWPTLVGHEPPRWPPAFDAQSAGQPLLTASALFAGLSVLSHSLVSVGRRWHQAWTLSRFDRQVQKYRRLGRVVLIIDRVTLADQALLLPLLVVHGERWWAVEQRLR